MMTLNGVGSQAFFEATCNTYTVRTHASISESVCFCLSISIYTPSLEELCQFSFEITQVAKHMPKLLSAMYWPWIVSTMTE